MKKERHNQEFFVQYLLGELSEDERTRLEQEYFGDDEFFGQLLVAEGELIDAYVRGELGGRKRERFEARFMSSPRQRERVEIARALVECATRSSVAVLPDAERREPTRWRQSLFGLTGVNNWAIRLALAAAVLVIVVGGLWFILETARLRNQVEQIQAERAEILKREQELHQRIAEQGANSERLAAELQRERSERELLEQETARAQQSALNTVAFTLIPGLVRGADEPRKLIIPRGAELVRINLDFEQGDYKNYRAVLETVDGKRILRSGPLITRSNKSGKIVTLELPARLLTKGDYIVMLSGVSAGGNLEPVDEYYLDVVKK